MFTDRYYEWREEQIPTERIGSAKIRTASTDKKCANCGGTITPGQKYMRQAWKVDGEIWVEQTHIYDCVNDKT